MGGNLMTAPIAPRSYFLRTRQSFVYSLRKEVLKNLRNGCKNRSDSRTNRV